MSKVKYIKTKDNQIIIFGEYYTHDEFLFKFNPISAGFIFFTTDSNGEIDCKCYGESISLGLKADEQVDSALARNQILGYGYF